MGKSDQENKDEPVFRKRTRPGRSRPTKRARSASPEAEATEGPAASFSGLSRKRSSKAASRAWQREEFAAGVGSRAVGDQLATAERSVVGGAPVAKPDNVNKPKNAFGPLRAPAHIRTSVRVDYQPDVCKDYKETGYCGFGDACKFLHDRGDYKAGWQLDRDWAALQKERRERIMRGEDPDVDAGTKDEDTELDEDGLPWACYICRNRFKDPVVTLCGHYFCEDCALKRMETDGTCAVCKKQLRGTLNTAHKLLTKLKRTTA